MTYLSNKTMLNAALAYTVQNGNRPPLKIFPCSKSKTPLLPKGGGCYSATDDEAQIKAWWSEYPNVPIGIATGRINGIVVIDIGNKPDDGKFGEEDFERLQAEYGPLSPTWEVISGGGGRHLYYKYPEGYEISIGNGTLPYHDGSKATSIDWCGNGGYVIAPPSMHKSGRRYSWEASSEPKDTELAELPEAWCKLLSGATKQTERFTMPEEIKQGQRDSILFKFCCSMRARGVDPGYYA